MLLFSSSTNVLSDQIIKSYIKNQWQNSRYINHNDGTVTDKKTILMWKQCPEGLSGSSCTTGTMTKYTYKTAIEHAEEATFATYSDWRLPNIKELLSLVARDRYNPAINRTLFPNTSNYIFWSSSPFAKEYPRLPSTAWTLNFYLGDDNRTSYRYHRLYVRLVRGGQ